MAIVSSQYPSHSATVGARPAACTTPLSRCCSSARTLRNSQVAVDLLTGPGRNPAEGQALLDWMEINERAWRK